MSDFVQIIEELTGKTAKLTTPPAPSSEPKITCANIDKARQLLDYNPQTPVTEGLAKLWEWYQREVAQQ
jgi:UDP-glucuronate 4-epimerase